MAVDSLKPQRHTEKQLCPVPASASFGEAAPWMIQTC